MKFISSRKDMISSASFTVVAITGYVFLVFYIADQFPSIKDKNKEIFVLSLLPLLTGVILKGLDSFVGMVFHSNSSDAEKGELAISVLKDFERLIRVYLECKDDHARSLAHREAGRCAQLLIEIYESIRCPVQKKGLLVSSRAVFPAVAADTNELSRLRIFDIWCGARGDLAAAMYDSLRDAQRQVVEPYQWTLRGHQKQQSPQEAG